jgi:hypothetical protein
VITQAPADVHTGRTSARCWPKFQALLLASRAELAALLTTATADRPA